jgi:2-oxoglutarate/2-oxoacid ferredoxin oxidoreductase subunit beta
MLMADPINNQKAPQVYASAIKTVWCPGCGNHAISAALTKALSSLGIEKSKVLMVSGIGCSSVMPHSFSTYGIDSLHGRLLPVAEGAKLANDELTVIGTGGDGDGYGIGVGHLIHAARRNIDMTYIVGNNEIYGLTTGQASPTTKMGTKTKSTPFGDIETPLNPLMLAISAGVTYVARAFAGDPAQLTELIKNGIAHRGFALIDVLSPCVTFNGADRYDWFRKRVCKIDQSHDPSNLEKALLKAAECDTSNWEKISVGLFYKAEKPAYSELDMTLKNGPLVKQPLLPSKEDLRQLTDEFR